MNRRTFVKASFAVLTLAAAGCTQQTDVYRPEDIRLFIGDQEITGFDD